MSRVEPKDVAGGGRICFRGDSREPAVMFKQGFCSREPNKKIFYNDATPAPMFIHKEHERSYNQQGFTTTIGKTLDQAAPTPLQAYQTALRGGGAAKNQSIALVPRTPDIRTPSAVCVSPRFAMAILFPPKAGKTNTVSEFTWVYAVYVRKLFNTHAQQVCDGLRAIENELAVRNRIARHSPALAPYGGKPLFEEYVESVALWPLYAQELATKSIEAEDVICAIKVRRTWKGDDWTYGCDYILSKHSLKFNKRCKALDKHIIKSVKEFFKAEPANGTTPSRASGFHKDDENTRESVALQRFIGAMSAKINDRSGPSADEPEVDDAEWLD